MANYTEIISNSTEEVLIQEINKMLITPNLIFLFAVFTIVFLLVGLIFVKRDRFKIFWIWFISTLISAGVISLQIINPEFVPNLLFGMKNFIS